MEAIDQRKLVAKQPYGQARHESSAGKLNGRPFASFSQIAWYFLAHSGEISVELIGRRQQL